MWTIPGILRGSSLYYLSYKAERFGYYTIPISILTNNLYHVISYLL